MKETGDAEVQQRRALHHTLCFDLQRRCMNQTYAGEEPEDQAGGSRGISSVGIAQVFVLHGDKIVCRWKFVDIRIYISSAEKSAAPRPRRQMCPVSPHPAVRPSTLERRGGEGPGGVQASHRGRCRSAVAAAHRGLAIPLGSVHLGTKPRELLVGGWGGCRRQRLTAAGAIAAVGCHASLGGEDCLGVVLVREINAQRAHRARGGGGVEARSAEEGRGVARRSRTTPMVVWQMSMARSSAWSAWVNFPASSYTATPYARPTGGEPTTHAGTPPGRHVRTRARTHAHTDRGETERKEERETACAA
eukprot:SAG25_NODE_328_length_9702_cov_9.746225_2_plen_304_part_00